MSDQIAVSLRRSDIEFVLAAVLPMRSKGTIEVPHGLSNTVWRIVSACERALE